MHSAPHRNNSDFQLRHFIAGSCHTADAAWNVLYEQRIDILQKKAHTEANLLRREALRLDLEEMQRDIRTEQDRLRYRAKKMEYDAGEGLLEMAIEGAKRELATIESLMAELDPHRKYKHLPLLEATEAAQHDEWREEFKHRVENYLLSTGVIPHDQLEAMRKHPDFERSVLPHIQSTLTKLENAGKASSAVGLLTGPAKIQLMPSEENDARAAD